VVPLYFARKYPEYENKMMRFRSIGEKGITFPLESDAADLDQIIEELILTKVSERSGRPMGADKDESSFERLRSDGYM
jgi:sulfate adenylyltransferase subunit 2